MAAGHANRHEPLKDYCKGLLLPGERKSIEPMAARLHPDRVQAARQSMHTRVAQAPWSDEAVLAEVRRRVLPAMLQRGRILAWIVDDTGIPKKRRHSVGVARQDCASAGQAGQRPGGGESERGDERSESARGLAAGFAPGVGAGPRLEAEGRGAGGDREFETKPEIALGMIRRAVKGDVPVGVVLADAGYGSDTKFREGLEELGLEYVVGVQSSVSLWRPGEQPLPPKPRRVVGRPPKLLRRSAEHKPVSARELVREAGEKALRTVIWREGMKEAVRSRCVAVRVRPAHRDYWRSEPHGDQGLPAEWPRPSGGAEQVLGVEPACGDALEATG
ncbi:MAG: hypothetical protein KatS3mg004_3364 [Bryobacteraceae bacterium]|nr:MAG: hypothetical protein KatS3mg004_3364 [Bryobacteraceae bacterium]